MSLESDLKSHLQSDNAITFYTDDRIGPVLGAQAALPPRINYQNIFGEPFMSLDGYTSGTQRRNVQIDCWASTHRVASELSQAVFNRLNVSHANWGIPTMEYPFLDDYEPDTKLYRMSIGAVFVYHDRADS